MNPTRVSISVMVLAVLAVTPHALNAQTPAGTAFTYQGQLKDGGQPVTNTCAFDFALYDAASGGGQVGGTVSTNGVDVVGGLFTVSVDFGEGRFTGGARWMEIDVECSGDPVPSTLSPRQELTPAPYALALPGLWTEQNATCPNVIGGYGGNSVTAGVVGATISGGGTFASVNRVTDNYGAVAGGRQNQAGDNAGTITDAKHATVGGGYLNTASGDGSTVSGGSSNDATGGGLGPGCRCFDFDTSGDVDLGDFADFQVLFTG